MILELVKRGVLAHHIVTGVTIRGRSRYDKPVAIPIEKEVHELLAAADIPVCTPNGRATGRMFRASTRRSEKAPPSNRSFVATVVLIMKPLA